MLNTHPWHVHSNAVAHHTEEWAKHLGVVLVVEVEVCTEREHSVQLVK